MAEKKRRRGKRQPSRVTSIAEARRTRSAPPPEIFKEDFSGREFVPEADVFKPEVGLVEARRAMAVMRGFTEALLGDPRVVRLFTGWFEQLVADPDRLNTDDALPLVRDELGLRWPWCVMSVLEVFHRMVPQWIAALEAPRSADGQTLEVKLDPVAALPREEAAVLAPAFGVAFETRADEGTDEAAARLTALYIEAMAELAAAELATDGGRAAKGAAEHLHMWGRWFYEARVARPPRSINEIAKENWKAHKHVRVAIREAERLLSLGEYRSPPLGG